MDFAVSHQREDGKKEATPAAAGASRLLPGVAVALVLAAGTGAAHAQSVRVPEICKKDNGAHILTCQKTCAPACDDPEFQFATVNGKAIYEGKCDKLLSIPENARKDGERCHIRKKRKRSHLTYEQCHKKVEEYFKDYPVPPPPPGALRESFEKRPSCATPIKKLQAEFICVRDQYFIITEGAKRLSSAGFGEVKSSELLCKLSKEQFTSNAKQAEHLLKSARLLEKAFNKLDECRSRIVTWSQGVRGVCKTAVNFPSCEKIVADQERQRAPLLKVITAQAKALGENIASLKKNAGTLKNLYSFTVDCGEKGDINNIPCNDVRLC